MNCAEPDSRPVLVPAGNKARAMDMHKQFLKPHRRVETQQKIDEANAKKVVNSPSSPPEKMGVAVGHCFTVPSILRQQDQKVLKSSLSLNASCSSEAPSDSSCSQGSTGRISGRSFMPKHIQRKLERVEKVVTDTDGGSVATADTFLSKKKRA